MQEVPPLRLEQRRPARVSLSEAKPDIPDAVLYELRKIPLHGMNPVDLRHRYLRRVYRILNWDKSQAVAIDLVLQILTDVYSLVDPEDGRPFVDKVLMHMQKSRTGSFTLHEFTAFVDALLVDRSTVESYRKLEEAKRRLVIVLIVILFIALFISTVLYFSSQDRPPTLMYAIAGMSFLLSCGVVNVLLIPIIHTIRARRRSRGILKERIKQLTGNFETTHTIQLAIEDVAFVEEPAVACTDLALPGEVLVPYMEPMARYCKAASSQKSHRINAITGP